MAIYFETKVTYNKVDDSGKTKKTTESYLVDAMSFTEAEARTIEECEPYIIGDFTVNAAKRTNVEEICYSKRDDADKWYLVKWMLVPLAGTKEATEKRRAICSMVRATCLEEALCVHSDGIKDSLPCGYSVVAVSETPILDVFPAKTQQDDE